MKSDWRRLTAVGAITVAAFGSVNVAHAGAATSQDFGPVVITGVPKAPPVGTPATQKGVPLATIDTPRAAGATAYVYSELHAYDADQVNLIDNEVRCSGAGSSNV